MKLLFCPHCQDILKLHSATLRTCHCGKSSGQCDKDGLHVTITGQAIPLGMDNTSLLNALESRPKSGKGSAFDAFVIPVHCETVTDNGEGASVVFNGEKAKAARFAKLLAGDTDLFRSSAPKKT